MIGTLLIVFGIWFVLSVLFGLFFGRVASLNNKDTENGPDNITKHFIIGQMTGVKNVIESNVEYDEDALVSLLNEWIDFLKDNE